MENNNEKRMAGCWEILHALHIGDKEVVVGENLTAPNEARYMCAYCTANDIMRGYNECMASDDYLEIMELYTERITGQIEAVKAEICRPMPQKRLFKKHCRQDCRHTRRCVKARVQKRRPSACVGQRRFRRSGKRAGQRGVCN